jgi:hypothetical protein
MTIQATSIFLPIDYKPTNYDILSGRGKTLNTHKGNMHFIDMIKSNLQQYIDAPRRMNKSFVIGELVAIIFASGSRFIKKHPKRKQYYVLNQEESYSRVGRALRDFKYKYKTIGKEYQEENNTSHSFVGNRNLLELSTWVSVSCSSLSGSDESKDDLFKTSSDSEFDIETISSSSIFTGRSSIRIMGGLRRSSLCRSYLDLTKEVSLTNFKF